MQKYKVLLSNIEWDLDDTYDGQHILPTSIEATVNAVDFVAALEHAMTEASDNHGWCILGCTPLAVLAEETHGI